MSLSAFLFMAAGKVVIVRLGEFMVLGTQWYMSHMYQNF